MSEHRRLNVAVTRAKRHVAVICNVDCVSTDPVLKTFTEYLSANGEVRTATQYEHLLAGSEVVRPHGMELVLKDSTSKPSSSNKKSATKAVKNNEKKKSKKSPPKEVSVSVGDSSLKQLTENEKAKEENLPERREELMKMVQKFVDSPDEKVFRYQNYQF